MPHLNRVIACLFASSSCALLACSGGSGDPSEPAPDGGGDTDSGTGPDSGSADCEPGVEASADTVITARGAVHGAVVDGVAAFLGIPYAEPPVGDLRWRAPEAHACWSGPLEATAFYPSCPQLDADTGAYEGDEDCLALNVWTPAPLPAASGALPVLFFVHGGGNVAGSTSERLAGDVYTYGGENLAAIGGAVVVTIQYRLGPLGWLVHGALDAESADGASGNYGLRDLVLSLAWVRDNIAAFGGDPARVLLFGESAGALDTCALLASPAAAGLFSAALMESGGCVADTRGEAEVDTAALLEGAGCAGADDEIACLRAKSPEELLDAHPPEVDVGGLSETAYGPWIDGVVLAAKPLDVIGAGDHNRVPFAVGANADETSKSTPLGLTESQYEATVNATFGGLADDVLAEYSVAEYGSAWSAMYHLTTDVKFVCPARDIARAAAESQDEPVFRYFFLEAIDSALAEFGAFHGAEIPFVFGRIDIPIYDAPAEEIALSEAMMGYWSRLAADGDPGGGDDPVWGAYEPVADDALYLAGGDVRMEDGVRTAQCDFWEALLP
jgi:para-nitrobenzyl esterase